jgi:hypothetical protein
MPNFFRLSSISSGHIHRILRIRSFGSILRLHNGLCFGREVVQGSLLFRVRLRSGQEKLCPIHQPVGYSLWLPKKLVAGVGLVRRSGHKHNGFFLAVYAQFIPFASGARVLGDEFILIPSGYLELRPNRSNCRGCKTVVSTASVSTHVSFSHSS